jgi:hypothetical protein
VKLPLILLLDTRIPFWAGILDDVLPDQVDNLFFTQVPKALTDMTEKVLIDFARKRFSVDAEFAPTEVGGHLLPKTR